MASLVSFLRWGWLLTIALFMPIALPVGGAQIRLDEVCQSYCPLNVTAGSLCDFRIVPSSSSMILRKVSVGTPMQILRSWESPEGSSWLHVQIISLPFLERNGETQRGWIQTSQKNFKKEWMTESQYY